MCPREDTEINHKQNLTMLHDYTFLNLSLVKRVHVGLYYIKDIV